VTSDIIALESDLTSTLLSWDMVQTVNIVQQRKLRLQNMADFATIYQSPRNGASGLGIYVEMPTWRMSNNISGPGPQTVLAVTLLVIECPPINLAQNGSGLDAETVAELCLSLMHHWLIDQQGEMYPQANPITPAEDVPLGCLGYRVSMLMQHSPLTLTRVTLPAQTISPLLLVTLTDISGLPGVETYFTIDGSTPCVANSVALKYSAPFSVTVGQTLRWQAYAPGCIPSTIGSATVTP